ncbi:MAG: IclR family transcriptional regulator [Polaromonas sp.]|uniref:IclR family transcriptional regulator n=1 Tax=Polaromonas sp. TaxID=1869339 RepID=UPI0017CE991F|nr:IclR family transcriptional regulator [Polaromonas sp.]MBA3593889.1 IclR family transcriptional regulator [Polaromonas sp.]
MLPDSHAVSAVDRALVVLATLAQQGHPLTATELVRKTGLSQSTLYRQLHALKRWGFVLEVEGRYAPGPLSLQLALGFDMASHLARQARQDMLVLAQQSQESVGLIVAVNGQAICIEMVESRQALRCSFEKGRSVPLEKGASAKCLLAHLPEAARDAASGTPELPQAGRVAELDAIRKAGFAVSHGEVDAGVWGVSAPLFAMGQQAVGALTLMAPSVRILDKHSPLIQMTVVTAARISRSLSTLIH